MSTKPIDDIRDIAEQEDLKNIIQEKTPIVFEYATRIASRGGKISPEVGVHRERAVIALLKKYFGEENVDDDPGQKPELDVRLFGLQISIKTITGDLGGIKASWSGDENTTDGFIETYAPSCDIILVQIPDFKAGRHDGFFFLIPLSVQEEILGVLGNNGYLKKLRAGTNNRGIEFDREAMQRMTKHAETRCIVIPWAEDIDLEFDPITEWIKRWS